MQVAGLELEAQRVQLEQQDEAEAEQHTSPEALHRLQSQVTATPASRSCLLRYVCMCLAEPQKLTLQLCKGLLLRMVPH